MPSTPIQHPALLTWSNDRSQDAETRLATALDTEWLETNGRGDYAASTAVFCATRRYHGLLVARPPGNPKRHVFLTRFEEHVVPEGAPRWPLSVAAYPDVLAPRGHETLDELALAPFPRSLHRAETGSSVEVEREVLMVAGQPTVLVRYTVRGAGPGCELELEPMFAFREADALTIENDVLDPSAEPTRAGFRFQPYEALPAVSVSVSARSFSFEPRPVWYKSVHFAADERRGYPGEEDQFAPGLLRVAVDEGEEVVVAATIDAPVAQPARLWQTEAERRRASLGGLSAQDPGAGQELAAEAFLTRDATGRLGVNAGYPWFVEWGRDTFIALPGLTLGRGDLDACFDGLNGALPYLRDGLLPNVYGLDAASSHYNSADAALWFARAVWLFERATGDTERVAETFLPALVEIGEAYRAGTELGMSMDAGGLLSAGSPELNATWMDAQVDGVPVTPRNGCPVEINALWYALLNHLEKLVGTADSRRAAAPWRELRLAARRSFLERFWLPGPGILADRWLDGEPDPSVRPNMVIAAALELSPLTRAQRRAVVDTARAELLTPVGLRTLAPGDERYRGTYAGGPAERDGAYHQGTAWPWLLGFFAEADVRARGTSKKNLAAALDLWSALVEQLDRGGLNHISEVFDGDPPHSPGGSFAQAWNTAEYLRTRAAVQRGGF